MTKISTETDEAAKSRVKTTVQEVAATAFLAGYETVREEPLSNFELSTMISQTSATLFNFVLLMVLYPEVQLKAQEELDKFVGRQRLPDFSDQDDLPYINAIYMEVIRLFPVLPLGVPHRAIAEGQYKGMRIPKGSIILPNAWYGCLWV